MSDAWETRVEREVEWDDLTRDRAEGLDLHDRECCPGCGLHRSIAHDRSIFFTFEDEVCPVCRAQDGYARILADVDQKADEAMQGAAPRTPRPADGRHTHLRPMSPDEIARVRRPNG